jgi:uncharacterized protein (TIGR02300 family)
MSTAAQEMKAARGIKRVCQACEVRFYDLMRESIVCPACGAQYTPAAAPVASAKRAPFSGKTGWRSKTFKRPEPAVPAADVELAKPADADAEEVPEDAVEETTAVVPEDDIVLEHEPDDGDVTGLVEHEVEDPKDR